jgi:hypothetical protein
VTVHTYYMDDGAISVPTGFVDRTVNALEWPLEGGDKLALVVQRHPRPRAAEGEPPAHVLEHYVTSETRIYPAQFTGYHVEKDEASGGGSAFEMRRLAFRWLNDQEVLYHHQVFALVGEVVLVLTCAAKARHREAVDRLLDVALADLRGRGD